MHVTHGLSTVVTIALFLALTGCASAVNTLPPLASPEDPTEIHTLYIPEVLEIKSVDFNAALFSDAADGTTTIAGEVGGRSFVKVYAVDPSTNEQFLLLYENIVQRPNPIQIIRFEPKTME